MKEKLTCPKCEGNLKCISSNKLLSGVRSGTYKCECGKRYLTHDRKIIRATDEYAYRAKVRASIPGSFSKKYESFAGARFIAGRCDSGSK